MSRTISAGTDLATGFLVSTGVEAVRQRVAQRLRLFRGEDFRAASVGVPYYQRLFNERLPTGVVGQIIASEILAVRDVIGVTDVATSFDGETRTLTVSASVQTRFGGLEVSQAV